MEKLWVHNNLNQEKVIELSNLLKVDPHTATLLLRRGIDTADEAYDFFHPDLKKLHDPMLMKDMDKAVERIEKAIEEEEKILIFGDYDVDGTTAVAVVYSFLRDLLKERHGDNFENFLEYYIPDRYTDGYGLSMRSIDYASGEGFTLMITLDCGIKANNQVDYAREKGIDVIVGDHHRPGNELPVAYALLDPKQEDCPYPYKELSGCGVGFKLIQAIAQKRNISDSKVFSLLDLVAISIASDVVPITGENRILTHFGLKQINSKPRPAIEAILKFSKIRRNPKRTGIFFSRELTVTDLIFLIGPRINAAGRMENGREAVKLLISVDIQKADEKAKKINEHNDERKSLDSLATQEALICIERNKELQASKSTVVFNETWHKGVIGIVASRLTEVYYRPTIVFTASNGLYTGSARSVKDFDIYEALDACSELIEHWGGHKYAAGLSIRPEKFDEFRNKFEDIVRTTIQNQEKELVPEIEIEDAIELSEITPKFCEELKTFAPFGPGNLSPVFVSHRVKDSGNSKLVGANHLKLSIFQPEKSSFPFDAIAFQQGEKLMRVKKGEHFDICYTIEENEWNGKTSIQLNVKDIKFV